MPTAIAFDLEVQRWARAAAEPLRIAEQLDPERESSAALVLYREGITALVAAGVAATEGKVSEGDLADGCAVWRTLERIAPALGVDASLIQHGPLRGILSARVLLLAPPLSAPDGRAACDTLQRLAVILQHAIRERHSPASPRRRRALGGAALAAIVVAATGAGIVRLASPKDLALHRPTAMSSSHPNARSPTDGSGLVNGVVEFTYGGHTNVEDNPWIQVDLETPVRVGRIVIHARGDGWFEDCVPLLVDVGKDQASMHRLARRDALFTRTDPWVIGGIDETIRFVRVHKEGHTYIALSEISVYGR